MNIKKTFKLSLLPLVFMLTSCTISPQQAFQNVKLTLVNDIKEHFAKDQTITNINYGEMQYILLNQTGDGDTFPANRYYYTGKITVTLSDNETLVKSPTTYYDLVTKQGKIFNDESTSFAELKKLINENEKFSGSQGNFFPSNY